MPVVVRMVLAMSFPRCLGEATTVARCVATAHHASGRITRLLRHSGQPYNGSTFTSVQHPPFGRRFGELSIQPNLGLDGRISAATVARAERSPLLDDQGV